MKSRLALAAAAALLLLPCEAAAQLNAEALRSALTSTPKFLSLQSALSGNAGNTNTVTYSGSVFTGILEEPHLAFVKASADYGQASGITNTAKWVAHARYTYRWTSLISPEAFVQVQHDRFRRLNIRDLYGLGFRFVFVETTNTEVFAGTAFMLEHEVVNSVPNSPGTNDLWSRSSDYFGFNYNVTSYMNASSVVYIQPRWAHPGDFRILSDSVANFTVTKTLSMGVTATVWYDSRPPANVYTYDLSVKNTITITFK